MPTFMLCEYFNRHGSRIEHIYIATATDSGAACRLRTALKHHSLDLLHDVIRAEANVTGATTSLDDAALALNALLNEIVERRVRIGDACKITSVSVNFRKAVRVVDVMPTLESKFGGNAACWVRGIFRHLNLGTPYIH